MNGTAVDRRKADIPGVVAPKTLPTFLPDGSILPPRPLGHARSSQ